MRLRVGRLVRLLLEPAQVISESPNFKRFQATALERFRVMVDKSISTAMAPLFAWSGAKPFVRSFLQSGKCAGTDAHFTFQTVDQEPRPNSWFVDFAIIGFIRLGATGGLKLKLKFEVESEPPSHLSPPSEPPEPQFPSPYSELARTMQ